MGKPPTMAHAVLANLYYRIWEGESTQLVGSFAAGGGSGFRLKVQPAPAAMLPSSDTIVSGPVIGGPGLALFVALGKHVVLAPAFRIRAGTATTHVCWATMSAI